MRTAVIASWLLSHGNAFTPVAILIRLHLLLPKSDNASKRCRRRKGGTAW